jgi:uncharacterized membrane protein
MNRSANTIKLRYVKYFRPLAALVAAVFAVYAGYQSLLISEAGAAYQIPQLEGDGGGGMIFAFLCFIGALVYLIRPVISIPFFILSAVTGLLAGFLYNDPVMWVWAIVSSVFAFIAFYVR